MVKPVFPYHMATMITTSAAKAVIVLVLLRVYAKECIKL